MLCEKLRVTISSTIHPSAASRRAPCADEYLIEKPRHSAFFQTELEPTLRKMNRDQVIVCGVFAHHGVPA